MVLGLQVTCKQHDLQLPVPQLAAADMAEETTSSIGGREAGYANSGVDLGGAGGATVSAFTEEVQLLT
jgi:hypothetical protein